MMICTSRAKYQVLSDGTNVWVNDQEGICTGRFGLAGVDIHHDPKGQQAHGVECLDCFGRGPDFEADWKHFVDGMRQHYQVNIPDKHKPIKTSRIRTH